MPDRYCRYGNLSQRATYGNYERYIERRNNGNIEIHDPYLLSRNDLSFKASQSRKVHIGLLSAGAKSFFDGISCEAVGVDVITGNM